MQILLTVSYDGTNYAGWQRQANAIAVQEKLEDALAILLARPRANLRKNQFSTNYKVRL